MTRREASELRRLAHGRAVLEVGSLLGYSTIQMAEVAVEVHSVDPHEGYPEHDPRPTLQQFVANLEAAGVRDRVVVHVGRDDRVLPWLRPAAFGLAFVDTTGRFEDTYRAMSLAIPLLAPGGALAVHDCGHPDWPGALEAVKALADERGLAYRLVGRLAVFDRPWPSWLPDEC